MQATQQWEPIVGGRLAERGRQAIEKIAADLQRLPPLAAERHTLPGGHAGLALFFAYRALATDGKAPNDRTFDFLERAVAALAEDSMGPALHGGFAGIGWVVEHLKGRVLDEADAVGLVQIDETLLKFLQNLAGAPTPVKRNYDLMTGLIGLGLYALERAPEQSAVACVDATIALLEETAERNGQGVSWFTPPELIPPNQIEDAPDGYYNMGLAHGVPGVVGFLGKCVGANVAADRAGALLEPAVDWLLANLNDVSSETVFPTWRVRGGSGWEDSRLAWCYGDPGAASGLMCAGLGARRDDWTREAVRIASRAAQTRPELPQRLDAGLCHGSGGLCQIFNRFFQLTGDETLRDGARYWYEQTLDFARPGQGVGGYCAWGPTPDGAGEWQDDPGYLTGAAGVGLVLLAASTPIDPGWDRVLLLPAGADRGAGHA